MIQKLLGTYSGENQHQKLYLEVSKEQFACWTVDEHDGKLQNFELFQFKNAEDFTVEFKNLLAQSQFLQKYDTNKKVIVIWDNENAQLIPAEFALGDQALVQNLVTPFDANLHQMSATSDDYSINFEMDKSTLDTLSEHFTEIKHKHKFDSISKVLSKSVAKSGLNFHILYFTEHCILSAVKDGKLQFIKRIQYQSPLDPVYFILNACEQFDTKIENAQVNVAGLITYESPLYQSLIKYVPKVDVEEVTKNIFDATQFTEHPEHYYVPFLKYSI